MFLVLEYTKEQKSWGHQSNSPFQRQSDGKTLKGTGKIEREKYEEKTKMASVISHSQHQFNDSVAALTTHGIIYRHIQTAPEGYTVKVYPTSGQVVGKLVTGPFPFTCRLHFHSSGHVALCRPHSHGTEGESGMWNRTDFSSSQRKGVLQKDGRLPKKQLLPPLAVCQHVSLTTTQSHMPPIPTKYSLQIWEHFPGPQPIPGKIVFFNFIPRRQHFRSKSPSWTLLLNLMHLKSYTCPR